MREQRTLASLAVGDSFKGFLMVRSAEVRTDKRGKEYADLTLSDRSGEFNCKMWNPLRKIPAVSSVVWVEAEVQEFNGRLQMKIELIRPPMTDETVDLAQLVSCAPETSEKMLAYIDKNIDSFSSEKLKRLVRGMLRKAGDRLDYYPAAMRMHHAEKSGLLHHITDMLHVAEALLPCYPFLNGDLLKAGIIVHDLAKIEEMSSDDLGNVSDYSRDGLLIGHLVRGVVNLELVAKEEHIDGEYVELLEHMILSHHGIPDYGSPKLPMFAEAIVLHMIDTLDAKMNEVKGIQDRTPCGAFSEKINSLDGRRMYHPNYNDEEE